MNTLIGLWISALAIMILTASIEPDFNLKDKVSFITGAMVIITLLFVGAWFICGGE